MAGKPTDYRLVETIRDVVLGLIRLDGADLSSRQMAVLLITSLEEGPHTVRGLADRLNVARPAITRALDRLEEFDLVRREPEPGDRRSVRVARTQPGTAYMAHVRGLLQAAAKAHGVDLRDVAGRSAA
jgi:DNA-binding MarR family transcriptional regulator